MNGLPPDARMGCPIDPGVTDRMSGAAVPPMGLLGLALHFAVTAKGQPLLHLHPGLDDNPALSAKVLETAAVYLEQSARDIREAARDARGAS